VAKKPFTKIPNWAVGAAVTVFFIILYFLSLRGAIGFFKDIELKTYDLRMKYFTSSVPSDEIVIVAIDRESISKLGRWPWPRARMAAMIAKLGSYEAKTIGLNIIFTEPEESGGLKAVRGLRDSFSPLKIASSAEGTAFLESIDTLEFEMDNDLKLETAIAEAGNVVLPYNFDMTPKKGGKDAPEFLAASAMGSGEAPATDSPFMAPAASDVDVPIERFGTNAAALGHLNKLPGRFSDGIDRWEALTIQYKGKYYPSFALAVAAAYLDVPGEGIALDLSPESLGIVLGDVPIMADNNLGSLINFYDIKNSFPVYSFFDVENDKISPEAFKDKIVLIGLTDVGLGDISPTPISPVYSGVEREATVIENILTDTAVMEPWWSPILGLIAIVIFGAVTTVFLTWFRAMIGTIVTAALFTVYIAFAFYMFKSGGMWIEITHPALLLVVNYLAVASKRFWFTESAMTAAESESDEANKLLGLTFQSKGMLEMAFEKFKKLPVDEEMKDVLYNLGLDFEKKRNWAQAMSVFEKLGDKTYKDVSQRIERLSTYTTGGGPVRLKNDSATIINEGGELPTLGRYEIVRELGRGAMGVVYLGKDPKINRQVAIKTVNFDEIEEKMIPVLKDRFFREAQSAGTLSHPNILTIYDVGEDGSLAYIAMELLDGKDLAEWAKKDKLLPPKDALLTVAKVADALDYAHATA